MAPPYPPPGPSRPPQTLQAPEAVARKPKCWLGEGRGEACRAPRPGCPSPHPPHVPTRHGPPATSLEADPILTFPSSPHPQGYPHWQLPSQRRIWEAQRPRHPSTTFWGQGEEEELVRSPRVTRDTWTAWGSSSNSMSQRHPPPHRHPYFTHEKTKAWTLPEVTPAASSAFRARNLASAPSPTPASESSPLESQCSPTREALTWGLTELLHRAGLTRLTSIQFLTNLSHVLQVRGAAGAPPKTA